MFEATELDQKISKKEFEAIVPKLRTDLLNAQYKILDSDISVIIIISGVEGAGKSEVVNRLNEWLDTRWIRNHAFWTETEIEHLHPRYWRFWRALPAKGRFSVMFGSWYTKPIIDRVMEGSSESKLDQEMQHIAALENMLHTNNTLIVKFWFHLPKEISYQRIKDKKQIKSPLQKKFFKMYDQFAVVSERALRLTDTGDCPWHLIEATDKRYRDLTCAQILLDTIHAKLKSRTGVKGTGKKSKLTEDKKDTKTVLDKLKIDYEYSDKEYSRDIKKYQLKLNKLSWDAYNSKRSLVAIFEGWDASGKGGAIRRVTAAMDARLYSVISVAAPTDEEKAHHYFWRFWRHLPTDGYMTIYDRSWYGRVLVERVEGFATKEEWFRSYNEINNFEEQLADHGIILLKFWIHISKDEQLRRFKEREKIPWKMHKITDEDWRNREKWIDYELAVNEMVARTSTASAPWILIPGNNKKYARIQVIKNICKSINNALK